MTGINYEQARNLFIDYCETRNLSPKTISYYENRLLAFFRFIHQTHPDLKPTDTTVQDLRSFVADEMNRLSVTTANHDVTTLKAFFNFLAEEEIIPNNPAKRLRKAQAPKRLIATFSNEQIQALLNTPDRRRFAGVRDYAILVTLFDTGLRLSELMGLGADDVDWNSATFRVIGKGDKERLVPFGRRTRRALLDYLARRGEALESDRIFVNEYGDALTAKVIQGNMNRYGKRAGISGVRVSPHTCRHTFAVGWIRSGGDIFSLQTILGHKTLEMCRHYVTLASEDIQKAHRLHSPMDKLLGTAKRLGQSPAKGRRRLK